MAGAYLAWKNIRINPKYRLEWRLITMRPLLAKIRGSSAGFSIIEISIILLVGAALFAGIWVIASNVITNYRATSVVQALQYVSAKTRSVFASYSVQSNQSNIDDAKIYTDSYGGTVGTDLLLKLGIFPNGYIPGAKSSVLENGYTYGLYLTKDGNTVWSGIQNSTFYLEQEKKCGPTTATPCATGSTILEIDINLMPTSVCTKVLLQLANGRVGNLIGYGAPNNGWGEGVGALYSNPTMPTTLTPSQAASACTVPKNNTFSYVTGTQSYVWVFFSLN